MIGELVWLKLAVMLKQLAKLKNQQDKESWLKSWPLAKEEQHHLQDPPSMIVPS